MKKEEKLNFLNKIKELIPQHTYICVCYHIVVQCCYQNLNFEYSLTLKEGIPELYKEIKREISRTTPKDSYSPYTVINYPKGEKISKRIELINRVISNVKKQSIQKNKKINNT